MSKKNDRAWFVCPQGATLVSAHYAGDAEAARALKLDPRVLARLRARTPVAKSTLHRAPHALASRHAVGSPIAAFMVDTRTR
jgi:hypothetical protein